MLNSRHNLPQVSDRLEATLCWMDENAARHGTEYLLKHTTRTVRAVLPRILYRIDVNTLHREQVGYLVLNDIARVEITTALPIFFDSYRNNRGTGSFVLIDPHTSNTVAGGMIRGPARTVADVAGEPEVVVTAGRSPNTVWSGWNVPRERREARVPWSPPSLGR